jgi:hypothetical protein
LSAIPSQWALQYFDFSSAIQLQAAFAHFLGAALAIVLLCRYAREIQAARPVDPWDAESGGKVVRDGEPPARFRHRESLRKSQFEHPFSAGKARCFEISATSFGDETYFPIGFRAK